MKKIAIPAHFYADTEIDTITLSTGTVVNMRTDDGAQTFARAVEKIAGAVQIKGARVFLNGWNHNGIRLKAGQLGNYAKTAAATPILFEHRDTHLLGVGGKMRASNDGVDDTSMTDALYQDMQITEELGRKLLALGIRPKFSIHWIGTEQTKIVCSACGEDMLDWRACQHWPGSTLEDGTEVFGLASEVEHVETSITFTPAVPGTLPGEITMSIADTIRDAKMAAAAAAGATMADDTDEEDDEDRLAKLEADIARLLPLLDDSLEDEDDDEEEEAEDDTEEEDEEDDDETTESTNSVDMATTLVTELQAERTANAKLTAKLTKYQNAEDLAEVKKWQRQKGLAGTADDLLATFRASRASFRKIMAKLPDSQLSKRVSGIPMSEPDVNLTKMTDTQLAAEATRMASESDRTYDECWREVRNRQDYRKSPASRHEEE